MSNPQSCCGQGLQGCCLTEMAEGHRGSQPLPRPFARFAGSKACDQRPTRLEPQRDVRNQCILLFRRNMCDRVECAYGIEGTRIKGYVTHICFDEVCLGDVLSSPGNLLQRSIDTYDNVTHRSQITGDWNSSPTSEIEHATAGSWEAFFKAAQPSLTDSRDTESFKVGICDSVVARRHDAVHIVGHGDDDCRPPGTGRAPMTATG